MITEKVEGEEAVQRFLEDVGPAHLLSDEKRVLRDAFIAGIRDGTIIDSGQRRRARNGKLQIVWLHAPVLQ
jgi:hypothetical protein